MMVTGVSGQTGAGKSTLADFLSKYGLGRNLEVDAIGHELLKKAEIIDKLVKAFGSDIIDERGAVCRKSLGRKAFENEQTIARLNSIMHPAMIETVKSEIEKEAKAGKRFFIVNAALLFSMGLDDLCDKLIYVVTSPEIRLKRLVDYRKWSEETAKERLFAQDSMPEGRSDIIMVRNDSTEEELARTAELLAQTLKNSSTGANFE